MTPTFPRTEQVEAATEAWHDEHDDEIREQIHTGERDRRGRLIPMEDDQ